MTTTRIRVRKPVTLTLDGTAFTVTTDRQVTAHAEGADVTPAAVKALGALGGDLPDWAVTLLRIEIGLRHCPRESPTEILALAASLSGMDARDLYDMVGVPRWQPMLVRDPDSRVREMVAKHVGKTGTPADLAVRLASDPDETVRAILARGNATPAAAAQALVDVGDPENVYDVAKHNPHPEPVLAALHALDAVDLRQILGVQRVLPEAAWPWLVTHPVDAVRRAVANNGHAPLWVHDALAEDETETVAQDARKTHRTLTKDIS